MPVIAHFSALPDNDKASLVRKLMQNGTPDFDYFKKKTGSLLMKNLQLIKSLMTLNYNY